MGRRLSNHSESPIKGRGSPHRKSPYRRERSPARHRNGSPARDDPYRRERSPGRHRNGSPAREKQRGHAESPKHERSRSPIPSSLSPRTKRLRRAQAEKEAEKEECERSYGRGSERSLQREGHSEKEVRNERKERRSARDEHDGKSSRSRHGHSTSPLDTHHKSRRRSHSPQPERLNEQDHERNHGRGRDRDIQRGSDREKDGARTERRSGRDDADQRSSRSKHRLSTSPSDGHPRNRYRSQSPEAAAFTRDRDEGPTSGGSEERNDEDDSIARMKAAEEALETKKKQQPSFELSGKLADETNRVRGVTLLFNEPPDARKPTVRWRLYVFKAGEVLNEPLYIHRQSCYLFGRERRVADIPTDHPSCSKQHAVIQYRQVEKENPDGTMSKQIKPYIMDLGSTNKTFINEEAIEPQRYYELHEKDTIKFGNSSREYVLLHENSNQD